LVARNDLGVDGQRRLELGQLQRVLQAEQLHAMAQDIQRATLVELRAQPLGKLGATASQATAGLAQVVPLDAWPLVVAI
jgi:hypothetical protein